MNKRKRAATWVVALSIICGVLIWHTVYWHATGMYLEMFHWIERGKGYITVLYNLGLMLLIAAVLGFLMEKLTELLRH